MSRQLSVSFDLAPVSDLPSQRLRFRTAHDSPLSRPEVAVGLSLRMRSTSSLPSLAARLKMAIVRATALLSGARAAPYLMVKITISLYTSHDPRQGRKIADDRRDVELTGAVQQKIPSVGHQQDQGE